MQPDYLDLTEEEISQITNKDSYNINIGVLGHVDSGKTSLCRLLSAITSTASLDKNPQSQERGITLDLGFSAFFTRTPMNLQIPQKYLQFTLVDCPGHASLLKTVIGGAQIIDLMFLVIDINKGIQTQTAECISIGQLLIDKMIIVLNKVDMLGEEMNQLLPKRMEALRKIFSKTKYGENVIMVPFSTKEEASPEMYVKKLKNTLLSEVTVKKRDDKGNFMMLVDHCFAIKGKGSVVTGTVLQGSAKAGDEVDFPLIQQRKKIKSMQMFKKPVNSASQGDRVALLFTQLQADKIERGICCSPGAVSPMQNCIIDFNKIRFFKQSIKNKSKYHVISGHQTVMANLRLFYDPQNKVDVFTFDKQYLSLDTFEELEGKCRIFCVLSFEKDFYGCPNTLLVGYKFDGDINDNVCRLAFNGRIITAIKNDQLNGEKLKIYKNKAKFGTIDKVVDSHTILVKDLFKKEVNINNYVGRYVEMEMNGTKGKIQSSFGNSGKVKVSMEQPVPEDSVGTRVKMAYKKYYLSKK